MKKIQNNKGMTLIEILAAIVIFSIVIVLINAILTSSTQEQVKQSNTNQNIKEISYALKVITKDFRKSESFQPSDMTLKYVVIEDETAIQDKAATASYTLENTNLLRVLKNASGTPISSEVIATNITKFLICKEPINSTSISCAAPTNNDNFYYIYIANSTGQLIQTDITIRSGS